MDQIQAAVDAARDAAHRALTDAQHREDLIADKAAARAAGVVANPLALLRWIDDRNDAWCDIKIGQERVGMDLAVAQLIAWVSAGASDRMIGELARQLHDDVMAEVARGFE